MGLARTTVRRWRVDDREEHERGGGAASVAPARTVTCDGARCLWDPDAGFAVVRARLRAQEAEQRVAEHTGDVPKSSSRGREGLRPISDSVITRSDCWTPSGLRDWRRRSAARTRARASPGRARATSCRPLGPSRTRLAYWARVHGRFDPRGFRTEASTPDTTDARVSATRRRRGRRGARSSMRRRKSDAVAVDDGARSPTRGSRGPDPGRAFRTVASRGGGSRGSAAPTRRALRRRQRRRRRDCSSRWRFRSGTSSSARGAAARRVVGSLRPRGELLQDPGRVPRDQAGCWSRRFVATNLAAERLLPLDPRAKENVAAEAATRACARSSRRRARRRAGAEGAAFADVEEPARDGDGMDDADCQTAEEQETLDEERVARAAAAAVSAAGAVTLGHGSVFAFIFGGDAKRAEAAATSFIALRGSPIRTVKKKTGNPRGARDQTRVRRDATCGRGRARPGRTPAPLFAAKRLGVTSPVAQARFRSRGSRDAAEEGTEAEKASLPTLGRNKKPSKTNRQKPSCVLA